MIQDSRTSKEFKQKTFSGYKKSDVIQAFKKSIDSKEIEPALNWLLEGILSGYSCELWSYLSLYSSSTIHINNPLLFDYHIQQSRLFKKLTQGLSKDQQISLRNDQTVINLLICFTILCIQTPLHVKYTNPKIKRDDFLLVNLQSNLQSPMSILPDDIVNVNEPPELKLAMNEIYFHLQSRVNAYDKIQYWIYWILEWEKINRKHKIYWTLNVRQVPVMDRYKSDVIWILWNNVFAYVKRKSIHSSVEKLFHLYCDGFDKSKRMKRLPYLLHAIIMCNVKPKTIELTSNLSQIIQAQCNYHSIIESKKMYEKRDTQLSSVTHKPIRDTKSTKSTKSTVRVEEEKTKQKLMEFNEIDRLLFSEING
jgi:hypothetical protein